MSAPATTQPAINHARFTSYRTRRTGSIMSMLGTARTISTSDAFDCNVVEPQAMPTTNTAKKKPR